MIYHFITHFAPRKIVCLQMKICFEEIWSPTLRRTLCSAFRVLIPQPGSDSIKSSECSHVQRNAKYELPAGPRSSLCIYCTDLHTNGYLSRFYS